MPMSMTYPEKVYKQPLGLKGTSVVAGINYLKNTLQPLQKCTKNRNHKVLLAAIGKAKKPHPFEGS
jgi:hypothetical protein